MSTQAGVGIRSDLERLYREQGDRLWRAVFLYAGDREIANDAVAEAFAQALRRGDSIRSAQSWVWHVSFRIAAGLLKERRKTATPPPEGTYEMAEEAADLTAALKALPPKQRGRWSCAITPGARSKRQRSSWTRRPLQWACTSPGDAAASGRSWRNEMPDLRTPFRAADRIAAPDLWPGVLTREPGEPPPRSPWGRVTTLAIAVGVAALAILVLIRVLPLGGAKPVAPSPTPSSPITPSSTPSPATLPPAGEVVGTIDFDSSLIAAASGRLFAMGNATEKAYTMARIDRDGAMATVRIRDPLTYYIGRLAVAPDAVYLGTQVIHRFTNAKDELVRIDASTLKLTGKVTLDDNVLSIVASRASVWVALSDRVLRLDPVTLATRATFMVPGIAPAPIGPGSVGSLALGRGGLWAVAGTAERSTLYGLDLRSLSVLARSNVPGLPDQGFVGTATDRAVWMLYQSGVRKVDAERASIGNLVPIEDLTEVVARGTGLVAMLGQSSIAQIDADGRVVALTENLGDIGGNMAVDGPDVWISAGATSILHFVLADVPPGS